jgi:hypothetical protein
MRVNAARRLQGSCLHMLQPDFGTVAASSLDRTVARHPRTRKGAMPGGTHADKDPADRNPRGALPTSADGNPFAARDLGSQVPKAVQRPCTCREGLGRPLICGIIGSPGAFPPSDEFLISIHTAPAILVRIAKQPGDPRPVQTRRARYAACAGPQNPDIRLSGISSYTVGRSAT